MPIKWIPLSLSLSLILSLSLSLSLSIYLSTHGSLSAIVLTNSFRWPLASAQLINEKFCCSALSDVSKSWEYPEERLLTFRPYFISSVHDVFACLTLIVSELGSKWPYNCYSLVVPPTIFILTLFTLKKIKCLILEEYPIDIKEFY